MYAGGHYCVFATYFAAHLYEVFYEAWQYLVVLIFDLLLGASACDTNVIHKAS